MKIIKELHLPHSKTQKVVKVVEKLPERTRISFLLADSFSPFVQKHQQP